MTDVRYLFLLIIALICCVCKLIEFYKLNCFRELVAWCVTKNNNVYRCNLRLRDYIHNAQNDLQIPKEYKIQGEEWDFVDQILKKYQEDLKEDYFCGRALMLKKSKYVIHGLDYFMFSVANYLDDHQCDYKFLSYDMHKETISYNHYGNWGGPLYDAEYLLTDFALIYHKLYYITLVYCQNCRAINSKGTEYQECSNVKEILDRKTLQVWCH